MYWTVFDALCMKKNPSAFLSDLHSQQRWGGEQMHHRCVPCEESHHGKSPAVGEAQGGEQVEPAVKVLYVKCISQAAQKGGEKV